MVDRLSSHMFRRHVACRSHHYARLGCGLIAGAFAFRYACSRQFSETKVQNLDPTVPSNEEVLRLQVTVNDPFSCAAAIPCAI
jgi:hypothetical protein